MSTRTSIKQLIQELVSVQMPAVIIGTVKSAAPVEITLLNDLNVTLSAVSLTVPERLEPLEVGKQYYLLSTNNNKSYYVLDKV